MSPLFDKPADPHCALAQSGSGSRSPGYKHAQGQGTSPAVLHSLHLTYCLMRRVCLAVSVLCIHLVHKDFLHRNCIICIMGAVRMLWGSAGPSSCCAGVTVIIQAISTGECSVWVTQR